MQHLHDMYQQPLGIDPVYEEESVVFITSENAETYAPVRITVAYGGQIPVPKGTSNRKYRLLLPTACGFIAGRLNFGRAAMMASRPCLGKKVLLGAGFPRLYLFRPAYIYPVGPRKELKFGYRV
jgi:hypothetical protein